jgi:NAD+ diphosphatase
MLAFTARASRPTIQVDDDELEHARWFTREELRRALLSGALQLPPPVSVSFRLIEDWFDGDALGSLRSTLSL